MLDEFYIEELVKKKFPLKSASFPTGVGDDAAVFKIKSDKIVFSCDSQVEGIHFDLRFLTPEQLAFRALSVALSDLCAMGAKPRFFSNSLFLPRKTSKVFIDRLFKGFRNGCKYYDVNLIGGNVSKSEYLALDVSVVGEVLNDRFKERNGSRVGDLIYVTGNIGDASLGLNLLKEKKRFTFKEKLIISKYKSPRAKVEIGLFLGQLEFLTSMIDITDGLSLDLRRLLGPTSSRRGATLTWEDIPKTDCKLPSVSHNKLITSVINGGDDYELLFTIKKKRAKHFEDLCKRNNFKVFRIGSVDSSASLSLIKGGRVRNLKPQGFVHKF